jgi:DNA-binding NtrC family response regulator
MKEDGISTACDTRQFGIVGASPAIRGVLALIERLAPTETTVLIHGETGTGKELVAEALHGRSRRAKGPFVVLDCSAIPEQLFEDQLFGHESGSFTGARQQVQGVFESAHGGTIFLDEIGELPREMQSRLLRVLEARQFRRIGGARVVKCDVRVVAATHRDLAFEVNRGGFRADLYYRLAVATLEVPALRDRKDDLELLIEHFCRQLQPCGAVPLPSKFFELAHHHSWPGNIRELRNAVERALILPEHCAFDVESRGSSDRESVVMEGTAAGGAASSSEIATAPSPKEVPDTTERDGEKSSPTTPSWPDSQAVDLSMSFKESRQQFVEAFERQYLRLIVSRHNGNVSAAARAAGMDRMTIYKVLRRLNISLRDWPGSEERSD